MLLKNLEVASGLCNGARGVVVSFETNQTTHDAITMPMVKFACGITRMMQMEAWTLYEGDKVISQCALQY